MYYVLLSGYNNYYNRIYKREDTIQDYIDASSEYVVFQDAMNFEYRDGISTEKLFNCGEFNGEPNYLLLKQNATDTTPLSRWFVVEWVKIRGGQYKAILRRDLLAEHYDVITSSPCFIEKGWVPNTDPAIFNKENMTFNQIKKREWPIKDSTSIAWLVGYFATDHPILTDRSFTFNPKVDVTLTYNHDQWPYYSLVNAAEHITINKDSAQNNMRFILHYIASLSGYSYEFMFNKTKGYAYENNTPPDYWWISKQDCDAYRASDWRSGINWDTCINKVIQDKGWTSKDDYDAVMNVVGKTIQFDDGVYRVEVVEDVDYLQNDWDYWQNGYLYDYLFNVVNTAVPGGISYGNRYPVAYKLYLKKFAFRMVPVEDYEGTFKYSVSANAKKLKDAPYKMIAIPYNTASVPYTMEGVALNKDLALAWAMDIAKAFGGTTSGGVTTPSSMYDFQILPFIPDIGTTFIVTREMRVGTGLVSISWDFEDDTSVAAGTDYIYLTNGAGTANRCIAFMCDKSSFNFSTWLYNGELSTHGPTISDFKESNECDVYRLCSPNYASVFEFSPSKNDGEYSRYNVYCTYKPYQPFVYIAPQYTSLYGQDFKDNRGLILAGDYSLPIVSDAWTNYQLANKNYQLAFDRNIEHMNVEYGWQRAQGITNAIVGTVQGGATGAMAGGMAGGGWGALAGAVIGTGGAMAGGVMDVQMQQALHNEALDFAKDNFGYQLGNIKALPNTLNKVSSLVATSKIFPYLEYYTCSDTEKKALQDKIKYNGMSIGRIGHILDFKNPTDTTYIKGQIIRLEGEFDTHTANEIANEFMKGWYI